MTHLNVAQPIFENRQDAGKRLAAELSEYKNQRVVVLAIPNGGVPVALEIAGAMRKAELGLVISRKIPLPLNPEAGFGAVADDGTVVFDEGVVARLGLSKQQMEYEVSKVRDKVKQRSMLYYGERPLVSVIGKTAIITDDGLASGYTMMAAVESLRRRRPQEIIVAVPVASATALERVEKVADKVVTCAIGSMSKFYIADFYHYWHELSDDEVIRYLRQWRTRHLR